MKGEGLVGNIDTSATCRCFVGKHICSVPKYVYFVLAIRKAQFSLLSYFFSFSVLRNVICICCIGCHCNRWFVVFSSSSLHCPVHFPVQSRPVPSRPVPSRPVPSSPVPSRPVQSSPVLSRSVPSSPVQSRPVPSRPVPS